MSTRLHETEDELKQKKDVATLYLKDAREMQDKVKKWEQLTVGRTHTEPIVSY